ncbi:MAG: hypothetical protein WDN28_03610 [Chthoniobacter sp.]
MRIGEAEQVRSEDFQEAGGAAAMLDVGPAVGVGGGHVKAVARGDEGGFVIGEGIARGGVGHHMVPAEVAILRGLHSGREGHLHEFGGHGGKWMVAG